MNKSVFYLCMVPCVLTMLLSGCGERNLAQQSNKNIEISEAGQSGEYNGEAEVMEAFEEENLAVDTGFEGSVKFEKDSDAVVSVAYDANSDTAQQWTVTTADGVIWNLTIPAHALLQNTTITMTALSNIESSSLGPLESGVLLEPDGLQFIKPAALTMSGDKMSEHAVLLGGNHDGSRIELSMVEKTKEGISASLLHFSAFYGDSLSDEERFKQVQEKAKENYREIRELALDYLKEPIYTPTPPAISVRCTPDHAAQNEALQRFLLQFTHPEESIMQEFLAAGRTDALLNNNDDNDAIAISLRLANRLMKKADKLFAIYSPQEDYLIPVSHAALRAERNYLLLGGERQVFLDKVAQWTQTVADQFLQELKEKHDYKLIRPIFNLGREAAVLGAERNGFIEEVLAALQFEVQYEAEVIFGGSTSYKTSGKAAYALLNDSFQPHYATGEGKYDSFKSPEGALSLKLPNSFSFETTIENFDPCKNETLDIIIDKFGAKSETYVAGGFAQAIQGAVQSCIGLSFQDNMTYKLQDRSGQMFFKFNMPLRNENVNAAESNFSNRIGDASVQLTIRLVHTPQ